MVERLSPVPALDNHAMHSQAMVCLPQLSRTAPRPYRLGGEGTNAPIKSNQSKPYRERVWRTRLAASSIKKDSQIETAAQRIFEAVGTEKRVRKGKVKEFTGRVSDELNKKALMRNLGSIFCEPGSDFAPRADSACPGREKGVPSRANQET